MYVFFKLRCYVESRCFYVKETHKYKVRYNGDFARDESRSFIICLNIYSSLLFETERQLLFIGITDSPRT